MLAGQFEGWYVLILHCLKPWISARHLQRGAGEEVAAAKVLEPPGPGVVEEGGQAPDDDNDGCDVTSNFVV